MDEQVDDQCINMEDNESFPPLLTDESRCLSIHGIDKEIRIFSARKNYVTTMLEIERNSPSPMEETTKKLEEELLNLGTKLQTLEARTTIRLNFTSQEPQNLNSPPQLNTTWSKFTSNLASTENLYLHTASSTIEIENQVRDLASEILTAHEKASKPVTHSEVPFVQGVLKHLFKERNRARKIWQFTRHPQDKTALNRLQNAIKRKVNLCRQQVWEDHLTSLDTEDSCLR
ncbi:uncharacterized protein TNCV_2272231 [Trichonephila clavipes]|nr:uncharacterized protein TNCV_2272231 [Trichonephila clavipes]